MGDIVPIFGAADALQRIGGIAARAAGESTGAGFKMSVEEMRTILPEWEDLARDLNKMVQEGQDFQYAQAPAADDGSTLQIRAAAQHAIAYDQSIQAQYKYAKAYAESLKQAIKKTEAQNHAAAEALRKHGRRV